MHRLSISARYPRINPRPQIIVVMTVLILAVSTGLHSGWPTPALPKLFKNDLNFKISNDQISYMVMIYPLAYIIADPLSVLVLDKAGRKSFIMILAALQIIAWSTIANANGVWMLYGGRFMAGVSEGAVYISMPIYICEIVDPHIRGISGMSYTTAFVFGVFLINCYGSFLTLQMSAYISIYVPLLFLITFFRMPESPHYLLMKGSREKARSALMILQDTDDVDDELNKLSLVIQRQTSEPNSVKQLFAVKSNLKGFFILIGLRTLQQLSGGWAVVYYNQIIFQVANGSISYKISSLVFDATILLFSFSGVLLIDKFGRRNLLLVSTAVTLICLILQAAYFTYQHYKYDMSNWRWFPLTGMVMYTAARGFGLMAIPSLMTGELFPANVKVKAVGMANIYTALCIGGTSKLFQFLEETYGMHVPFLVFVVCTIFGICFVYFCVPETKGKTLEEIQERLRGHVQM
ncbi:hypothetical protein ILUMI_25337 [Ignelater luminosus]|uniref:Major facilitator superfamily (MFS) profile domain-containing protein n=1 Tax=Ignelater luminosus TaxID=2038154 RepID=A0A8K0CA76_IGNLU|nr:hypothetical protein ILUMI_25337 [Ignelater luminosus]